MIASLQSWDSKSLLLSHLAECPASIVVGWDVEAPRGYYSCSLKGAPYPVQLGIIVNQQKAPSLLLLLSARCVLVGHDQSISIIDLESGSLLETILLEGIFFEFLRIEEMELILVLHELGCMALSEQGEVLWQRAARDVLEGWRVVGDRLELTIMDDDTPEILNLRA